MPKTLNRLTDRWLYWLPLATIASKRLGSARTLFNPSGSPVQRLRIIHERTFSKLQALGIPLDTISKHELDDPRLTDDERTARIGAAIERRRTRMNRIKGQVNRHR